MSRKPLSEGSVAANVLKHGTGAINIDGTRVRAVGEVIQTHSRSPEASKKENRPVYGEYGPMTTHQTEGQQLGRWPGNLLLVHRGGCQVRECVPGCPAAELDRQSGITTNTSHYSYKRSGGAFIDNIASQPDRDRWRSETGGASRYFKQFGDSMAADIPQDLIEYLHTMITPAHIGGETLVTMDLASVNWSEIEDGFYSGLIARTPPGGDPSPYIDEIWRVVKPGAHVMLIAPDDEPTGHTGACALEDRGFEIRDAILVAQEAGHLHYVPKAARAERHAGTEHLARKRKGAPIYDLDDGTEEHQEAIVEALQEAGVEDDIIENMGEEGIPRNLIPKAIRHFFHKRKDANKAPGGGNNHPTVKPKDVLVCLLDDVPKDAVVLDPFMGSGSMGLACLETGHSYIGIEKEAEYLEIADARVRHWDRAKAGWVGAEIESEHKTEPEAKESGLGLDDLFGF
jgi:DNA modification methylase